MKKIALLSFILAGTMCLSTAVNAQQKKSTSKVATTKTTATKGADGFTHLASGLDLKIVKHGNGKRNPKIGDHLEMHIHVHIKDSSMFDSRKMNNNKPVPFQVQAPSFKGDPIEGFMKMVAGDSAVMKLPVDSLLKQNKQMMPGMKAGDVLIYEVVLVSAVSDSAFKMESTLKADMQRAKDDADMIAYFKKNNIKAIKTATGLYYTISKEGTGETAKKGQNVSVNYTGRLLDGKAFDSNTDPEFHHTDPFSLVLGTGSVIRGWDEGLALLKKGSKATLYIPSGLAYGSQDRSPTIPANSVLVFDVEILDITTQADLDDKVIKEYLTKNNIKASKTASGLYYTITKEGVGEKPIAGQKVSVNYTGMTTDGKKFDSNVDPEFKHTTAFEFQLGAGQVIKGWDEGLALLSKGGKATLFIPSGLAYGQRSPTQAIPPNSVLLFDVELVDIIKQ